MKRLLLFGFLTFLFLTNACSTPPTPATTQTPEPTETLKPTITPTRNPYVILSEPFLCGDGITDISTNASFNGLFKPNGLDQYHGHMDIYLPDGCDFTKDILISPISGFIEKYTTDESDPDATNWGYHLFFPDGIYPNGIEDAFKFAGVKDFNLSQIKTIIIHIGHVNCKTGNVASGEPICSIVPMHPKYGATRVAMQIGIDLVDGRGFMFSPTLFQWSGKKWSCDRVPSDGYCEPRPNFYKPGTK